MIRLDKAFVFSKIRISTLNRSEMVNKIIKFAMAGEKRFITYLNAHCANISFVDAEYLKILQAADLVYAGGQGVVWASRILGNPLPERVNTTDIFNLLVNGLREKKITIYLLGGEKEIVKKTEEILKKQGIRVLGSSGGFFDKEEEGKIIWEINALRPNILMVGMGVPKQEKWIYSHLNELNVHLCWSVGATFEWVSGQKKRVPNWMINFGLEWLYRLFQEPKRLWKRYIIGNFIFVYHVLNCKMKQIWPE